MITAPRMQEFSATALATAVGELAPDWYESARPVPARLLRAVNRPHTSLYWFEIAEGRTVVVKLARDGATEALHLQRQYEGLLAVHRHFSSLRDQRIGAIRPLAFLYPFPAVVMEHCPEPSLRRLLSRSWFGDLRKLEDAFRNCGAWLRAFHSMPPEDAPARRSTREEFIASAEELCAALSRSVGMPSEVFPWLAEAAAAVVPDRLPLALRHGDYAMRNVLIGEDARALALDIEARWRSAPYEDVAYFLTQLHTSRSQLLTKGLITSQEQLAACEQWFLEGYGRDALEPKVLLLFRIRALLDRWATMAGRASSRPHTAWFARLQDRRFGAELRSLRSAVGA